MRRESRRASRNGGARAVAQASRTVLAGVEVRTDVSLVRWPNRYSDPRGEVMWSRVTELVGLR